MASKSDDNGRPKLSDIAKAAGVSVSTVSKVINGRPDIGAQTRELVEKTMNDFGYQKSLVRTQPINLIEVVFQEFQTMWAMELLKGVTQVASANGISVTVTELGDQPPASDSWTHDILERRPIGVILVFSDLSSEVRQRFQSRNIPFLTLDPAGDPAPETICVRADNWTGELIATRHLITLGHRRIGIITGPLNMLCARARYDGFTAAMAEAGIEVDPKLVRSGRFEVENGYELGDSLLSSENPPTAIIAGNDLQALGVYDAARKRHISIPDDLSIIGFDNISISQHISPALTTITQPLTDMARRAAEILLSQHTGQPTPNNTVFPTTLVVRESTAPPRK